MKVSNKKCRSGSCSWPNKKLGFTLIELLVIFGMITLTIVGYRLAGLLGCAVGFLVVPVVAGIVGLFQCLVKDGIPTLPRCRNGLCSGSSDYEIKRFDDDFFLVCKCGGRYKKFGRRFMQVTDQGGKMPYMIWRPFKGWFPDEEKPDEY